jgi:preprotein translocase subunit SecD
LKNNMMWKIVLIVAVLVAFVAPIIPTENRPQPINLGLDLRGGTQLVMQVNTVDAVRAETDQAMESYRGQLERQGLPAVETRRTADSTFVATIPAGVPVDQFERIGRDWLPAFGVTRNGQALRFDMQAQAMNVVQDESVAQAIETIRNRVDALGVAEPIIARAGGVRGDRIVIQLPGVDDPNRVKDIIQTTAQLQFRIVEGSEAPDPQQALATVPAEMQNQVEILPIDSTDQFGRVAGRNFIPVRTTIPVTGADLKMARVQRGELGQPNVGFSLTPEGGRKFGALTGGNVGRRLAIVLDGQVKSAPVIQSQIIDQGQITGTFSQQEATDLALILRSGALPASLTILEERTVGPSLGRDSIVDGTTASIIGFVLVLIFMVVWYKGAGINAVVALLMNLVIILGMMSYFGANLTLPGIAGLILTLGMAVDANVLVFERIREELRSGKSIRASIEQGFSKAFGTIIDANLTTMISALFLFQFGSGPVKGFAVTLLIGLTASVFTAFFVSRVMFDLIYNRGERPTHISI